MPRLDQPPSLWRDRIRRIEDLGFSAVSISEHITKGWAMEPVVALMAAASATERLRLQSLVLNNDFRHPAILHKSLATIDVLSGGRLEIGLGAGWMREDYEVAGMTYDLPATRIARLEESVRVLKGLFAPSPFDFVGSHYRIQGLDGLPKPVQTPHPPFLLGGGGRRMLSLAAQEANIVNIHPNLGAGLDYSPAEQLTQARTLERVRWVREAAAVAGRSMADIELQINIYVCRIIDAPHSEAAHPSVHAAGILSDPLLLRTSPAVLVGSVNECVETLLERREQYGFSCFNVGGQVDMMAPVVARLAGC